MDGSTVQCNAKPMRMANSTACRLSTGSEPGSPRQTGHTLVLGSAPKALRHPQNSFVAVLSSQWTSSPMTVSHPVASAIDRLLQCRGDAEHQWFLQRRGEDLDTDRKAVVARPVGNADGGMAGQIGRDGAHVGHVHRQWVLRLGPELE